MTLGEFGSQCVLVRVAVTKPFALFRRLGVNVETLNQRDFSISYFALAKRYHPDRNPHGAELKANINAARATILNSYRSSAPSSHLAGAERVMKGNHSRPDMSVELI